MSAIRLDEVFDYVNGALSPADNAAFELRLLSDATLRADLDELREILALVAISVPTPSPALRARVLASAQVGFWEQFLTAVAAVWDLSIHRVKIEFERARAAASWESGPFPGVTVLHLNGGPATAGADVGIVRFAPGTQFVTHGHSAVERYVVLQGRIFDSAGRVELPGETVEYTPLVEHSFTTDPDQDTVIALVLHGELLVPPPSAR